MNLIGDILPLTHILLDSDAGSKKRLFEQAGLLLETEAGVPRSEVFDCLFAREKLGSTGLGQGVAVPHGRLASLKKAAGVFIRTKEPVPFDAPDGKPVSLAVVLLVPEDAAATHLEVLSQLAARFSDKSVRERLMQAQDAAEVQRILTEQ
ncbi:PTS IIA-like nitrogen regulatory protein PtsN [Neisseria sp. WLZKY-1]|jgi:PTS IIA-like nitrogen-regulatory protein ptsN|uniref:PTS IIA-like nitrogen regulatory protein PtsN n=1 Tax=Neisseria sp. WLZKY-1 TaxID=3390377 RepID=UPI003979CC7A